MSLTLRQLQKCFSAAERGIAFGGVYDSDVESALGRLGAFVTGVNRWRRANVLRDGGLLNACKCYECKKAGTIVPDVRRLADRWAREYGPNADLLEVIEQERAKQQPPQGQPGQNQQGQGQQSQAQPGQGQSGQSQQGQGQQGQGQSGQGQPQPSSQTQTTGPASGGDGEANAEPTPPPPAPTPPPKPQPSPQQKALEAAKRELKDALEAAAKNGKKPGTDAAVKAAKRKLGQARKKLSYNSKAQAAGVSLTARKQVSRGLGRLQNVSQKLRNQMAELINRLVEHGGTVGETTGPVPVLSASKLVKRMVVRRPLPNALKEDTVAGRPVVLFLPDISPSCAEQAQPACDLANAAGYAGVAGSDVLVLPHFNGGVDSSEEYIPWFNGRPAATSPREAERLFEEVCRGESSYRVRVVVMLGDHHAVDRYGEIAELRSVTRVLWLHNWATSSGRPEPTVPNLLPNWRPEAMEKLSMAIGCVDQSRMLRGFDLALKMK